MELNFMKPVTAQDKSSVEGIYYLPHHAIIKDSTTTKLRVVFDASSKTESGVSLNDNLLTGPKLQSELIDIILRFRTHKIALVADIEKMYRQIDLLPSDTNYQRILWRFSTSQPIVDYNLTTVTYGVSSAPYLATRVLQQLAEDEERTYPLAARVLKQDFYMDDLISGSENVESALLLQNQLRQLLSAGGFHLRKWASNHPDLLCHVPVEDQALQTLYEINPQPTLKTLGLQWCPGTDQISFSVPKPNKNQPIAKRTMLAAISRLFDPLGLLSPCIIIAKFMIQRLWTLGLGWDEDLPTGLNEDWTQFFEQLQCLKEIRVNRWIPGAGTSSTYQLHGFADASELAYCAAIYIRSVSASGLVTVQLLTAKTRVAPLKRVSLPRLELCGALMLATLMNNTMKVMNNAVSIHTWTDSTIVLAWIRGQPHRWQTFVANRVSQIQDLVPPTSWNHVRSEDNPVDCASRGVSPELLNQHPLWWTGAPWLAHHEAEWPRVKQGVLLVHDTDLELRPIRAMTAIVPIMIELLHQVSSLTQLQRVTALCFLFIYNCRNSTNRHTGELLTDELQAALDCWVRLVQSASFSEVIKCVKDQEELPKDHFLRSLSPFLDDAGILRVGGRLRQSVYSYEFKHPILLPKKHPLTTLIIRHEHLRHLHAGLQLVLSALQQRYWIIHARDAVRQFIHKCIICYRLRAKGNTQIMGDLPKCRLEPVRPFLRCGVDYGGPLLMKWSKGRGKQHLKAYICVFVCFTVRAVHIELVSDLSTGAFLNAFRRFIARRGRCADIYSDNGTNFVGAKRELKELHTLTLSEHHNSEITKTLALQGIRWHLTPPGAPHFGGIWEAGIRSIKHHLRRIMGNQVLTFEELSTLLTEIEACLNSRPLTPLSNDPNDWSALTPGHFLIGEAITSIPEPSYAQIPVNRLSRWQLVQRLSQHFWNRWKFEYLTRLRQRPKWTGLQPNIKVGDLVLLKDDQLPRLKWKLARVTTIHPGPDGKVRVATVKTESSTLKRPVVNLCPLPLDH